MSKPLNIDFSVKPNKYGAKKVSIDGMTFHSQGEYRRYCKLLLLERAGEIQDLQRQVKFILQDKFKYEGKTERAITYTMDFVYKENGKQIAEDFKGIETQQGLLRMKLFKYKYQDYIFRVSK